MQSRQIDVKLFTRLDGAFRALSLAVQDPVVLSNDEIDLENGSDRIAHAALKKIERIDISRVYFYCNDEEGETMMRERIQNYASDVRNAYKMHKAMYANMRDLDSAIDRQERRAFRLHAEDLCSKLHSYATFVADHIDRAAERAFLEYPHSLGTYSFREPLIIPPFEFNPERSHGMLLEEVAKIRAFLDDFVRGSSIPFDRVSTQTDTGSGWDDGSYRATIALTKMLLKEHLDFDVEQ